jgi:hypothetical protein
MATTPRTAETHREMLAEAVRNTAQLEPERARRRPERLVAKGQPCLMDDLDQDNAPRLS